jgi:hypothetical protein
MPFFVVQVKKGKAFSMSQKTAIPLTRIKLLCVDGMVEK